MRYGMSSVWALAQRSHKARPGWHTMWVVLGTALVLLVLGVPDASASASPWVIQPTPTNSAGYEPLTGVSCVSGSDCVAVGGNNSLPNALGWNGTAWSALPAVSGLLNAIACPSASYCIAVGQAEPYLAAAWAWNGSTWTQQSAYNPSSTDNVLNAITCRSSTSCEAVGSHGNGGTTYPLAEAWNGKTWTAQSTSGAPPGALDGVSCESSSKCEAVGYNTYTLAVLAMGLDKSKWVAQSTPQNANGDNQTQIVATSVSCWSSGCTAVGGTGLASDPDSDLGILYGTTAFADSWNGSKWTLKGDGNPSNSIAAAWSGVVCHSAAECVAVGGWTESSTTDHQTLISTWNGSTWTQQSSPDSPGSNDYLYALSCKADGTVCEAVGAAPNNNSDLAMGNG